VKTHIPLGDGLACGSTSPVAEYSTHDLCARCVAAVARRLAPAAPTKRRELARERATQFVLSILLAGSGAGADRPADRRVRGLR
jgi:hypothetical protein